MATTHLSTALREITDNNSGKVFHLFVRMTLPHITLLVLTQPGDGSSSGGSGGGWVGSFKNEVTSGMQPQSLSSATRATWLPRVSEALLGHQGVDKYSFTIGESSAAAETAASAGGSGSGSRRKAAPSQSSRRAELKVSYRDATLIRFPLSNMHRDSASLMAVGATAGSPFGAYRADSIRLLERVAQLTDELQSKNKAREDKRRAGEAKLVAQLDKIQTKAMVSTRALEDKESAALTLGSITVAQKCWMEEGVLAQLSVLLDTKDQEIKRLRDEKEALNAEIAALQLRSQLSGLGDSASSLTEQDIARMAVVIDDEEGEARRNAHSDNEDEGDEEGEGGAGSDTAAAAAAKPARGGRKAPAKAAAARKPRAKAPAKPRGKKAAAAAAAAAGASDSDAADTKPPVPAASKKRTRKRIRSPSPVSEEDSAEDAWSAHEEEGEEDAVAAVAAYERAAASSAAKAASASAAAPAVSAAAPRRTRSGGRLPTPHASPLADSQLTSSLSSQALAFNAGQTRKRAVSPPPRVLPKRSLAQILRDGAAGLEEPDEDEEDASLSASASARPAVHVASPRVAGSPPAAAPVASLPPGVAPMDISSQ